MKNLILYYLAMLAPAVLLAITWKLMIPEVALSLLVAYLFIYRTWLDGNRLSQKGLIAKKDIWKIALPGYRGKYLKDLYLRQ